MKVLNHLQTVAIYNGGPPGVIYELYVYTSSSIHDLLNSATTVSPFQYSTGWSQHQLLSLPRQFHRREEVSMLRYIPISL